MQAMDVLHRDTKPYSQPLHQRQGNVNPVAGALTARIKMSLNISKNERRKKTRKG